MSLPHRDSDLNITRQLSIAEQIHNQTIAQTCLTILLFLFGLFTIRAFLPSLIWGVIFAIACWPLYIKAKKHWPYHKPEFLLPLIFSCIITFLFMFPLTIIAVEATKDVQTAFTWIMHASHDGVPPPQWLQNIPFAKDYVINWWNNNLADPQSASDLLSSLHLSRGVYVTQKIGAQIFHRGLLFLFTIITLFFLFKDGEIVIQQCLRGSRRLFGIQGENIAKQMISSVHGTVSGLVLVGLGQGIILGIVYALVGIPHAALFGIMTAIAAMIPFCPIVAIAAVALTALLKVSSIAAITVVVIGCIVVFIADHFIRPALIGGSTKLPFIWVLIGILGGLESWGMIGLFIGPAIMAALMMLWCNWTAKKKGLSSHNT
ncbi:Predicted PurR-regulated permease PerM (PerM) [Commensalibacter communis]|uniref:AI-2E family transporter n=1 Tax=Commensalibacter communis TaxID=2972786 RepID=UPI0022FF73A3|nr:AI-2E family transporter [Commensalibacter communis]CAI3925837.1 Predicted PurR-regulated permease PerM (PerM) [Commensalibacter communis]CAI3933284.1 Predicted PurR-regulated permease PerM (PerM) [Commensalibacter communis]